MDERLWERAKDLASANYIVEVSKHETEDGSEIYLAKNPELYGCMAQGLSKEEALENLSSARLDYIYSLLVDGLDVPVQNETRTTFTTANAVFLAESDFEIANLLFRDEEREDEQTESELLFKASLQTLPNE